MPDEVYRTARSGGAHIVEKFSEREKPRQGTEQGQIQQHNRGSAVPLRVNGTPLSVA